LLTARVRSVNLGQVDGAISSNAPLVLDPKTLPEAFEQLIADPYPVYRRLREADPVHWSAWGAWYVSRYEDIAAIKMDHRFSVSRVSDFSRRLPDASRDMSRIEKALAGWLLFMDRPQHTRLRALISKSFTPRTIERMQGAVERRVDQLLDALAPRKGIVDLIADLANVLPVMTIADMLGADPRDHRAFEGWSHHLVTFLGNDRLSEEDVRNAEESIERMESYFRSVIAERRAHPSDDLVSSMLAARDEGQQLEEHEILSMATLLFAAGHDTTANLIGNGLHALLRHWGEREKLLADPQLVEPAVEEILRFDNPSLITSRTALEDVEIGGRTIKAGDNVNMFLGSANHDPSVFDDPETFDIERRDSRHLSFGKGIHTCVGAFLARMEARVAIGRAFQRWPTMTVFGTPSRYPTVGFRRLQRLPVRLAPVVVKR
jgi:cytochrome P450